MVAYVSDTSMRGILWRIESTEIRRRPGLCPGPLGKLGTPPYAPSRLEAGKTICFLKV